MLTKLLTEQHKKYPSHGYHRLADDVFQATGWIFSHNLAHKCCKQAGIYSKARKYHYKKNEEQTPQIVLHSDQGSVYFSQAFQRAHEHYNILRSMSKVGTPTDNAIIEALNGWIKEELHLDFGLENTEDVPKLLDEYVHYYNNRRPAAALGYKSPVQYKTELGF